MSGMLAEIPLAGTSNRLGHPGNTHHSSKDRLLRMAVVKIGCHVWQLLKLGEEDINIVWVKRKAPFTLECNK